MTFSGAEFFVFCFVLFRLKKNKTRVVLLDFNIFAFLSSLVIEAAH